MQADPNLRVRMVIDGAVADLQAIGAGRSEACALLAIQVLCRLSGRDLQALKAIKDFVDEAWFAYARNDGGPLQ